MGCSIGGKISSSNSYKENPKNPNPFLYEIVKAKQLGDLIIAQIKYIGCTNFEGNKILVFQGISLYEFKKLVEIDPHFAVDSKIIARFVPTEEGWLMAVGFALTWSGINE